MAQRVSFLFGSGVSTPAGMPSVSQITEKVLSGNGVMRPQTPKPLYCNK